MSTPSVEPVLRSRLLPPISFRILLAWTTLGAIAFSIARAGGRGAAFALAIEVAIGFLLVCLLALATLSLIAWVVGVLVVGDANRPDRASPFAEDRLPPQLLPPRDPTS